MVHQIVRRDQIIVLEVEGRCKRPCCGIFVKSLQRHSIGSNNKHKAPVFDDAIWKVRAPLEVAVSRQDGAQSTHMRLL